VGYGPLAKRPANPTTIGVGYWATDQDITNLKGMVGKILGRRYLALYTNARLQVSGLLILSPIPTPTTLEPYLMIEGKIKQEESSYYQVILGSLRLFRLKA